MKKAHEIRAFSIGSDIVGLGFGGDEGDRTPDLSVANAALSQLSYIPVSVPAIRRFT